jgi:hypothetical protein
VHIKETTPHPPLLLLHSNTSPLTMTWSPALIFISYGVSVKASSNANIALVDRHCSVASFRQRDMGDALH